MTQKELLYLKDAYEHEDKIIMICENMIELLEDNKLSNFIEKEIKKHITMKDKIIKFMEEKSNE